MGDSLEGSAMPGPLRLADLRKAAAAHATRRLELSVGGGPVNFACRVHLSTYNDARELSDALAR